MTRSLSDTLCFPAFSFSSHTHSFNFFFVAPLITPPLPHPSTPPPTHPPRHRSHTRVAFCRDTSLGTRWSFWRRLRGRTLCTTTVFLKGRGLRQKRCRLLMVALHENTRRGGEGVAQRVCDTDNRHPRRTAHGTQAPTSSKSPAINSTLTNDLFSNNQKKIFFILPLPFFLFYFTNQKFLPDVFI